MPHLTRHLVADLKPQSILSGAIMQEAQGIARQWLVSLRTGVAPGVRVQSITLPDLVQRWLDDHVATRLKPESSRCTWPS